MNVVYLFGQLASRLAGKDRTTVNGSCYLAAPGETGLNWSCETIRFAEQQFSRSSTGAAR